MKNLLPFVLFLLFFPLNSYSQDSLQIDKYAAEEFYRDSLTGTLLPLLELTDVNGVVHKLADYRGKVVFINFWRLWCPPCMGEVPEINQLYTRFKDSSCVFISLAIDDTTRIRKFMNGGYSLRPIEPFLYPVVAQGDRVADQLAVDGFPTSIFIDKKGIIRLVCEGGSLSTLKNYVDHYGTKTLSRGWKKTAKLARKSNEKSMYEQYVPLIRELISEE